MAKSLKATPKKQPRTVIEEVDPRALHPDPNQPRQNIDSEEVADLAASIGQLGIINPIEVNGDDVIVTGELRWRAAIEAGLKTVPVRRLTDLEPAQRFFRQVIENLQHNELNGKDATNALAHLRDLRRRGELPPPAGYGMKSPKPQGGRPPEPGSTRELAAMVGKSRTWVRTHLSDTYITPNDIPEKLHLALVDDRLHHDAVVCIRRRCPEPYREALIDRLVTQTAQGYVETPGVQAVVDGLREVAQQGGSEDTARKLIGLVRGGERGSFIAAAVKAVVPQTPEEHAAVDAKDERSFAHAVDGARRQLATERTVKFSRQSAVRNKVERLVYTGQHWLQTAIEHPPGKQPLKPAPLSVDPTDFHVTTDMSEAERLVLEVLIIRTYLLRKTLRATNLTGVLSMLYPERVMDALRNLKARDAVHETTEDIPARDIDDEDRRWYADVARRFVFDEGAFVSLKGCRSEFLGL